MARPRRKRTTEFLGNHEVMVKSKYAGNCRDCGRFLKAGDGYAWRSPGDKKWKTTCGQYGCVDRSYHGALIDPEEHEVLQQLHEESFAPAPYSQADLEGEHSGYSKKSY